MLRIRPLLSCQPPAKMLAFQKQIGLKFTSQGPSLALHRTSTIPPPLQHLCLASFPSLVLVHSISLPSPTSSLPTLSASIFFLSFPSQVLFPATLHGDTKIAGHKAILSQKLASSDTTKATCRFTNEKNILYKTLYWRYLGV